jgi:hypothetical protein
MGPIVADLGEGAIYSRLVIEQGLRPRVVNRHLPGTAWDSGWRFIEGSEDDEWLNAPGAANAIVMHLAHAVATWPELAEVVADARAESEWEWDESSGRYREYQPSN